MKSFSLSLFGGLLFVCVNSHSWLHCSNYHAVIDSDNGYSDDECEGYIRQWSTQWGATSFGTDRGVNYFGSDGAWCQSSFSTPIASMYDSGYPYADWYVGDTVRLVWPAKNHANYECFSNVPDTSMKLYYNPSVNPTSEITGSISDWTVLVDWQSGCTAGTDGCGFQNCPTFCDDTDKAPCYGDLQVTSDKFSSDGFYTLMWYWIFNGGTTAYTTCFEVYVHSTGGGDGTGADTPSPTTATSPVPSPTKAPTHVGDTEAPTPQPTEVQGYSYNYSCADLMRNSLQLDELSDGYYDISYHYYTTSSLTVYCQFDYESNYAWTLIESFSFSNDNVFYYYSFSENYDYSQLYPSYRYSAYRLSNTWMKSIFDSMSVLGYDSNNAAQSTPRYMAATCNFDTNFTRDWVKINLEKANYNPLTSYWSGYDCAIGITANIRGYECNNENETIYIYNSGYHLHIDSDNCYCDCCPWESSAAYSENNFGRYGSYYNTDFECSKSSSATTNWWLGQHVITSLTAMPTVSPSAVPTQSPTNIDLDTSHDFLNFTNVTCNDIESHYDWYEHVTLYDCLYQCKLDAINAIYNDNNNNSSSNKCRYVVYFEKLKTDSDTKCFLFDKWCEIEQYNDKHIFVFDYKLESISWPLYWMDRYNDVCNDYEKYEWCINGVAYQSYEQFDESRDINKYNLTAIDVCQECSGGISSYNDIGMSISYVTPFYNDYHSLINQNDLLCYLDFETMYLSEKYSTYMTTNDINNASYNNNNNNYLLANSKILDKINLYSVCEQYISKLTQFYMNKEKYDNAMILYEFFQSDNECPFLSLTRKTSINTKFHVCEFNTSMNYIEYYNNYQENEKDLTNFIMYVSLTLLSINDSNQNTSTFNDTQLYGYSYNDIVTYNVFLSSLWVDIDSLTILTDNSNIYYMPFEQCNDMLYDENYSHLKLIWLACDVNEFVASNDDNNDGNDNKKDDSTKWQMIIGGSVATTVGICLIIMLVCCYKRHKRNGQLREAQATEIANGNENANGLGLCTICQENLVETANIPIIRLRCTHQFHEQCWNDFKQASRNPRSVQCPNCRRNPYN